MRYLYCLDRFRHHDMRHRPWPPTHDSRGHSAARTRCTADHASVPCRVWIPPLFPPGTSCRSDHLPAASAQSGGRMLDLARAGGTRKTFRGQWSCLALLERRTSMRVRAPRLRWRRRTGGLTGIGRDRFWCGSRTLAKGMCIVGLGTCAICDDAWSMPLVTGCLASAGLQLLAHAAGPNPRPQTLNPESPPPQVCNYSRKVLGQTGDGHFSPVAAWDPATESVLIMDVARFKYPPHWVPISLLYEAMLRHDAATSRPRGWLLVSRPPHNRGGAVGLAASLLLCTPAGDRATAAWTSFAKKVGFESSHTRAMIFAK